MKLNVYGRKIEVVRSSDRWLVYYLGNEGKKRTAHDIAVPNDLEEEELIDYLEDVLHEWASPAHTTIVVID